MSGVEKSFPAVPAPEAMSNEGEVESDGLGVTGVGVTGEGDETEGTGDKVEGDGAGDVGGFIGVRDCGGGDCCFCCGG